MAKLANEPCKDHKSPEELRKHSEKATCKVEMGLEGERRAERENKSH